MRDHRPCPTRRLRTDAPFAALLTGRRRRCGQKPSKSVPPNAGTLASADFMSLTRATPDIGAYRASGSGDPGWRPAAASKIADQIFVGDFQAWP